MPWRLWPMKDVEGDEMPWGAAERAGSAGLRMGQPGSGDTESLRSEP